MADLKPVKPLSGFIELSPEKQRVFDYAANKIKKVFETAGFVHLDLPAIERAEVLGGGSDEVSTQIYFFEKGDTKMGLRYDGTIGFARYIAGHQQGIFFPFRSYQFAKNYRGERPQKGRYREFYQMDIDIIDENSLSENYDAEIIKVMSDGYASISDLIGEVVVRIGSRSFWNTAFNYMELDSNKSNDLFVLIDKKDKLSDDDFRLSLIDLIGEKKSEEVIAFLSTDYSKINTKNNEIKLEIDKLNQFENKLKALGLKNYKIDLSIMRGHGYYTGVVFEFFLKNYPEMSAIGGGGRYENLCERFSKKQFIGVGGAIGFSRMMVALLDEDKIKTDTSFADVTLLIMNDNCLKYSLEIIEELRKANVKTIPFLDTDKKFKKQMEFANKINAKFAIIIGEYEVKNNQISLKNMKTGEQKTLTMKDALAEILK